MNEQILRKALEDIHQRATDGSPRSKGLFSVIIAQIAEQALRTQPQAPVCTRCKDPIKVGVCENCAPEIEPQAPAVGVSREYVRQYMESELPEYGVWTDDVIDAIHALLQSKGGR